MAGEASVGLEDRQRQQRCRGVVGTDPDCLVNVLGKVGAFVDDAAKRDMSGGGVVLYGCMAIWKHDKVMDTYYYMNRHTVKTLFCSCREVANANEFKSTLNQRQRPTMANDLTHFK